MLELLETISQLAGLALLICALYYYFHFKKIKRQRKLTKVELCVYITTQIAMFLWASSSLLLILDKS